jgi:hypothetical protein
MGNGKRCLNSFFCVTETTQLRFTKLSIVKITLLERIKEPNEELYFKRQRYLSLLHLYALHESMNHLYTKFDA